MTILHTKRTGRTKKQHTTGWRISSCACLFKSYLCVSIEPTHNICVSLEKAHVRKITKMKWLSVLKKDEFFVFVHIIVKLM